MNIMELWQEKQRADAFNNTKKRGFLTVEGFGFDIRVVNELIYCSGVRLPEFISDLDLSDEDLDKFLKVISEWLIEPYLGDELYR